jgi:flagellar protein FliJ
MPRPFHFNLQKVLDYRTQLEDQAKLELAKAQRAFQEQAAVTRALAAALGAHQESFAREGNLSAARIWLWRAYKDRLDEDLAQARITEAQLAQDVRTRRAELVERAKERKLLEKLKQNQGKRHELEENRLEQAQYDEMATLRHQPQAL